MQHYIAYSLWSSLSGTGHLCSAALRMQTLSTDHYLAGYSNDQNSASAVTLIHSVSLDAHYLAKISLLLTHRPLLS